MQDEVRETTDTAAWQLWTAEWHRFERLRLNGPALIFLHVEVLGRFFKQVRCEEELFTLSRSLHSRNQDTETPV